MSQDLRNKESILRNSGFQTILASLLCIVLGLLVGFIVLLVINPLGAAGAIAAILKNFLPRSRPHTLPGCGRRRS